MRTKTPIMSNILKIQGTPVLAKNLAVKTRFTVNQGGARSSKTHSILQMYILMLMQEQKKVLTITRKTFPSLRASAMRDFFDILMGLNMYNDKYRNKTENTYVLNKNLIEFVSLDQPQKIRGGKRDYLFMNEANEFTLEDFKQLNMRTSDKVVLDYNPSDEYHWIYDWVIPRENCTFIKSTYKDNPYCPAEIVKEIEYLKIVDPDGYQIYGLGNKGEGVATIYSNWHIVANMPEEYDERVYGLDFGYNNPTSLTEIRVVDKVNAYLDETLYETRLTNSDLINRMRALNIPKGVLIKCDSAEPDRIKEIRDAGYNARPARKGKNSVKDGIDKVKTFILHITDRSVNIKKEIKSYKWQVDKDERVTDVPVKYNDHSLDGIRYGIGDGKKTRIGITDLED